MTLRKRCVPSSWATRPPWLRRSPGPLTARCLKNGRTLADLKKLSGTSIEEETGATLQHIAGEETTNWNELHHEWIQDEGLWVLLHPEHPTIETGGSIDELLYQPGPYIPSSILSAGEEEMDVEGGRLEMAQPHFPGIVWRHVPLSTHYSLFLQLPADSLIKPR